MKILRLIGSMNPNIGGPSYGIRNSVPVLYSMGVFTEVVCLDSPDEKYLGSDNFTIFALGTHKNPWCYSNKLFPWLIENLETYQSVIVHGLWLYHSYAIRKAINHLRLHNRNVPKLFVMPHGMLDPYFQHTPERKWKAIRNWFYWHLIEHKVINTADAIFFTCEEEMNLAKQTFTNYHPKKETNIGYGILPPPPESPAMYQSFRLRCPTLNQMPYILFLSRIHHKKGVNVLIKSYLDLKSKGIILPKLVIAGPGLETAYGKKITKLANNDTDIIFPGMLSGNDKWGAIYGCEIFILPSHQENFGIAVVEALACGKPVLISHQVNIYREIEQQRAGIIGANTAKGVTNLLQEWAESSINKRIKMSINAKATFEKYFTVFEASKKLISALQEK